MLVSFIQDLGLISIILLVSFFLRHKIGLLQRLFIPVSILAGLLALSLGNYGLGYLQFSDQLGNYPGIMIAFLFASLPFTLKKREGKSKTFKRDTFQIGGTALVILLLQWGTGVLFGLTVLHWLFPEINAGFGGCSRNRFFWGAWNRSSHRGVFCHKLKLGGCKKSRHDKRYGWYLFCYNWWRYSRSMGG